MTNQTQDNTDNTSAISAPATCPACFVGRLQRRRVTFARFYGNTLIHIPNAPAQVCDTCALTIPDEGAIQRIETLLGHAGPPPNHHQSRPAITSSEERSPHNSAPREPHPRAQD